MIWNNTTYLADTDLCSVLLDPLWSNIALHLPKDIFILQNLLWPSLQFAYLIFKHIPLLFTHFEFAVWSFIYTFQIIKSAQIQVTIINNCAISRLHTLHKVINFNYLTFEKSFADRLNSVNTAQKIIPVLTDWARLIQRIPWEFFSRRVNSVNTDFP